MEKQYFKVIKPLKMQDVVVGDIFVEASPDILYNHTVKKDSLEIKLQKLRDNGIDPNEYFEKVDTPESNKIIFLDIDGVLNNNTDFVELKKYGHFYNKGNVVMNTGCIALLQQIIEDTDAKIVISSNWKLHLSDDDIYHELMRRGFQCPRSVIVGRTENFRKLSSSSMEHRGQEIKAYLKKHPNIEKFVILDDARHPVLSEGFLPAKTKNLDKANFIHINHYSGLTTYTMNQAIQILGRNEKSLKKQNKYEKDLQMLLNCCI